MSNERGLPHGVMEGKGAYNKHAKIPAGGAALAVPFLEKAVQQIGFDPEDRPVVIADYGSSQGKNSQAPMQIAIRNLRTRVGPNRPIFVFHVDQPSNDFNSLFEVLSSDPDRYALDELNVFPCAIGRSFYEQVLPPDSLHLGWCSYAAVWLSRIPSLIPGHFFPPCGAGVVRAAFERQGAEDWEAFLSVRACEMRLGARLVVVLPGVSEMGCQGLKRSWIMRTLSWLRWSMRVQSQAKNGPEWYWDRTRGGEANFLHRSRGRGNSSSSVWRIARYSYFRTPRGPITSWTAIRKRWQGSKRCSSVRSSCPRSPQR